MNSIRMLLSVAMTTWPASALAQTNPTGADTLPEWRQLFDEFLAWNLFEIPVWRGIVFVALLVLGLLLKNFVVQRVLDRLDKVLQKSPSDLDNAVIERAKRPLQWLAFIGMSGLAVLIVKLPEGLQQAVMLILQTLGTLCVAWMLFRMIDVVGIALERFTSSTESDMDDHLVPLVVKVLRVVLVVMAIVTTIQQWGYDVTSLIAGLGIGGLAIALAAQDTLGNWFGGIMIFTDRPFKIGDWVKSAKFGEGVVEEVGLRSTKIRTFTKTVITVPNKDLAASSIENCSEMTARRIKATLGVEYGTTPKQMRQILAGFKKTLTEHEAIDPESVIVNFVGYADSALEVLVYAFTNTTDYQAFMDARQDVYLAFMDVVEEAGSGFAFPSTSLYFENDLALKDIRN